MSRTRLLFGLRQGRTRLVVADVGAPLKAMRAFPLPDGRALLQIISAAPGLLAGDRYEIAIETEPGARAVVVTPAATKLHRMASGERAEQTITLRVAAGASLEYYPALNIPFPESEFRQRIDARVEGDGRLGLVESWSAGRSGEHLAFRRLESRTAVDLDGEPVYRDALDLGPDTAGWGALEGARYVVSGYWLGGGLEPAAPEGELAVSGPVEPGGVYLRGLYADSLPMEADLARARAAAAASWGYGKIPEAFIR